MTPLWRCTHSEWCLAGLCVCGPWCGLYGGAAYMLTPESSFDDFAVVRLVHRAAYIPKITVHISIFWGEIVEIELTEYQHTAVRL